MRLDQYSYSVLRLYYVVRSIAVYPHRARAFARAYQSTARSCIELYHTMMVKHPEPVISRSTSHTQRAPSPV